MNERTRDTRIVQAIADVLDERWGWGSSGSSKAVAEIAYDTAVAAGIHDTCADEWDDLYAENERLRGAIQQHRDECLSDDIGEPTEYHGVAVYTHTVKLWNVLNEIPVTESEGDR